MSRLFVSILLLVASFGAQTQDIDFLGDDLFGEQNFLPVKEAFQPTINYEQTDLIVHWDIVPEYYLYQERFNFVAPGQTFSAPIFETGEMKDDEFLGKRVEVYYESTNVRLPNANYSGPLEVIAQGCADAGLCYPPTSYWFSVDSSSGSAVNISEEEFDEAVRELSATASAPTAPLAKSSMGFLLAILMAFGGGIILNLMPCVFPVLAIKALKISSGGMAFSTRLKDSISYTSGILVTTIGIAAVMLALRAGGAQIGWGFQLQSPAVVTALMYLFFVVGLGFSGWLLIGAQFAGVGQSLVSEGKPFQSFFTGVLAMVVASPCSAPFMAASLGYAVQQPSWVALVVFAFLGLGMAFPLVLLNTLPALSRLMPKPGAWMETLKEFLAFPMYLTCAWLLYVLMAQISALGTAMIAAGLSTLAAMFWGFKQQGSNAARIFAFIMLFATIALVWQGVSAEKPSSLNTGSESQTFALADLDAAVGGDRSVFLDVTADWCITCKFNESRVLYSDDVQEMFLTDNTIYLVADWTNDNPEIGKLLDRYNRVGIPLYLYFPAGSTEAEVLPQILTKDIMRKTLL